MVVFVSVCVSLSCGKEDAVGWTSRVSWCQREGARVRGVRWSGDGRGGRRVGVGVVSVDVVEERWAWR